MLRLAAAALLIAIGCQSNQSWAHGGSHDAPNGVFQVAKPSSLPKSISLQVVKTNAEQFALATDGSVQVEVLDPSGRPFIRFHAKGVEADLDSAAWYRAQMPGGGKVPDRITPDLPPKWTPIQVDQPGLGWYDNRLVNEDLKNFELSLTVDGKPLSVPIKKLPPPRPVGQWVNRVLDAPEIDALTILLPQPRSAALMLQFAPSSAAQEPATSTSTSTSASTMPAVEILELLDDQGKPFIRFNGRKVEFDQTHPWARQLQLKSVSSDANSDDRWTTTNNSGRLVYQEPRLLQPPPKQPSKAQTAVHKMRLRLQPSGQTHDVTIESRWEPASAR